MWVLIMVLCQLHLERQAMAALSSQGETKREATDKKVVEDEVKGLDDGADEVLKLGTYYCRVCHGVIRCLYAVVASITRAREDTGT